MEPVTLSLVGGALFWGIDRWREHRAKKAGEAELAPRVFSPIDIARFTHQVGPSLRFDHDLCGKIRGMLASRSVSETPIDAGPLGAKLTAWKVGPYKPGVMTAGQLLQNAQVQGLTVLGSLSLVLIPSGSQAPMLLLVGGPHLAAMAGQGGHFALLPGEVAAAPEVPLVVDQAADTEPAPAPSSSAPAKPNGVSNGTAHKPIVPPGADSDEILDPSPA